MEPPRKMEAVNTMSLSPDPEPKTTSPVKTDTVELKIHSKSAELSPVDDYAFEWKDINFHIGEKQILHDISGGLARGQLMAIMGGSGAGKSSFLNVLCGRQLSQNGYCGSQVTVSGQVAMDSKAFSLGENDNIKYLSAYVMQEDVLTATDTPRESILFSARLRLPTSMSDEEKKSQVDKLISELRLPSGTYQEQYKIVEEETDGLTDDEKNSSPNGEFAPPENAHCRCCYGTKCGKYLGLGNTKNINCSGGEKKRTSVGVELVTEPNLIFLDEPTSGLDSFTAMKTLQILKKLSRDGRQVIATIHQPSAEIFMMFDQLCLLAKGRVVYFGSAAKSIEYFESLGYPLPEYTNPADHVVNLIQENPQIFIQHWNKRKEYHPPVDMTGYDKLVPQQRETAGFCRQFLEISKRELRIFIRDPRPSRVRFAQTVLFALLVGALYWQLPHSQQGLRDRFGAIFFVGLNASMTGLMSAVLTFPEQRVLFERERKNTMYPTWVYVFVKGNFLLAEQTFFVVLYISIVKWMVGFDSEYWQLFVTVGLTVNTAAAVGMLMGTFADDAQQAMLLATGAFIPLVLFANFLVSLDQIPEFIRWIQWLDLFKYSMDALSITEFEGVTYSCQDSEFLRPNVFLQQLNISSAAKSQLASSKICPITHGDQYLDSIDVNKSNLAFDWYMLLVLFLAFRLISCGVLMSRNGA